MSALGCTGTTPAFEQETLFCGRWRIAEITRATDPMAAGRQTYVLDPGVRSNPELAEVASYVDFCVAMEPAAEQGHGDRLALELKQRFSRLLGSYDWRLVDAAGKASAARCPFFLSDTRVDCSPRPISESRAWSFLLRLFQPLRYSRVYCAMYLGIPYRGMKPWTREQGRNILSPENVRRVREAFEEPHNVVFGYHYYYRGGCSPSEFVFADFDTYLAVVEASKPGDYFTGYSLASVRHLAFATFGALTSDEAIEPAGEDLLAVREILKSDVSVEFVGRKLDGDRLRCLFEGVYRLDDEEVEETLAEWRELDGELILFRDDGARDTLVDAKRPNACGRTPLSGAY